GDSKPGGSAHARGPAYTVASATPRRHLVPSLPRSADQSLCCHEEAPIDYLTYVRRSRMIVSSGASQLGRDDRRAPQAPSSATGSISARPFIAWGFLRVHLTHRGRGAHAFGQGS